jgi:hypothetical protein
MNKFVLGALALSAASTPCLAGTGTDDTSWTGLDRDISTLSSSLAPAGSGAMVSGFIKTSYANSGDVTVGGNDLGGFSIDNARLNISGTVGDYSLFISLEGSTDPGFGQTFGTTGVGGGVGVLDAIASWNLSDEIKISMGQFRPAFLASSLRSDDSLLFIDRTTQGDVWAFRDQGAMASGNFDQLGWAVSLQNGADGAGNDLVINARVTFTAMGTAPSATEGAYGSSGSQNLTIGVGYYDDDNVTDGSAISGDVYFTAGALSASAEVVAYDDGLGFGLPAGGVTGQTPWDVVVGYMVVPDQWEVAVRYEDFDDTDNSNAITAGINYYRSGHAAKWQFNWSTVSSDNTVNEIDMLQLALVASI